MGFVHFFSGGGHIPLLDSGGRAVLAALLRFALLLLHAVRRDHRRCVICMCVRLSEQETAAQAKDHFGSKACFFLYLSPCASVFSPAAFSFAPYQFKMYLEASISSTGLFKSYFISRY